MCSRIITHDDFDGIISATICAHTLQIDTFFFTGPRTITEAGVSTTPQDIVCDLPCPAECGMWFDHHAGNKEDLEYRQIDPASVPGRFAPEPSCARVIFDYFSEKGPLPDRFREMTEEADIIDSFAYSSIDDWQRETPGKVIDGAVRQQLSERSARTAFLTQLTRTLTAAPLSEVADLPWVRQKYDAVKQEEEAELKQIKEDAAFHADDPDHELVIIDRTGHSRQHPIRKNLAYIAFPGCLAAIEIKNRFRRGVKSNDLALSMSLSLTAGRETHQRDVGEIMRRLNIGDGHPGAGAGSVDCGSKSEMLKTKERLLKEIIRIWRTMTHA